MAAISASIKGRTEFLIQTHNEKLAKVHARQHGEHRTNDEVKLNAALKPMDAKKEASHK